MAELLKVRLYFHFLEAEQAKKLDLLPLPGILSLFCHDFPGVWCPHIVPSHLQDSTLLCSKPSFPRQCSLHQSPSPLDLSAVSRSQLPGKVSDRSQSLLVVLAEDMAKIKSTLNIYECVFSKCFQELKCDFWTTNNSKLKISADISCWWELSEASNKKSPTSSLYILM